MKTPAPISPSATACAVRADVDPAVQEGTGAEQPTDPSTYDGHA